MKAKISHLHQIKDKDQKQIGRINLVNYYKTKLPHIEFDLDPEFWNKGIMTKELGKYLQDCKRAGVLKLMAVVRGVNPASCRVLEKSGFWNFARLSEDTTVFIIHLDIELDEIFKESKALHRATLGDINKLLLK